MADDRENQNATVLVAHVTVHLESGQAFELLPFIDENDVKSQVTDLIEDWSRSGFLVRGSQIVPWHQVQWLEATQVEEIPRAEAERRASAWNERNPAQYQQAFWKTKEARGKKEKDEAKDGEERKAA
ncbi:MAG TPA: hypothetical protein VIY53_05395 [Acidobacteriaceae bacterium]